MALVSIVDDIHPAYIPYLGILIFFLAALIQVREDFEIWQGAGILISGH